MICFAPLVVIGQFFSRRRRAQRNRKAPRAQGSRVADGDEGLPPAINASMRLDRDIQMFLGIAQGILLDGRVDDEEIENLLDWCEVHPEVVVQWPANRVYGCLNTALDDGVVDERERREITALLEGVTSRAIGKADAPASLPFDDPLPAVEFQDRAFVFTGQFAFGP